MFEGRALVLRPPFASSGSDRTSTRELYIWNVTSRLEGMQLMEQGSYLQITAGMRVVGADGTLGVVSEVIADPSVDVFRGIMMSYGFLAGRNAFVCPDDIVRVTD